MLINGERINVPFRQEIRFPRVEGDIVFKAEAISVSEHFEKYCPAVEPKIERDLNNQIVKVHFDDPKYVAAVQERNDKKFDLQVIKSITNVVWETVDLEDSSSWKNWKKEALQSGLSDLEIIDLINRVFDTLRPSASLVKEQRESFLAEQARKEDK